MFSIEFSSPVDPAEYVAEELIGALIVYITGGSSVGPHALVGFVAVRNLV